MKTTAAFSVACCLLACLAHAAEPSLTSHEPAALYPPAQDLSASPGNTTYLVDPVRGDDANNGTQPGKAWKSLAKVNALRLAPGDRVRIAPGVHRHTLKPSGAGTAAQPVVISFLPGRHEFAAELAVRRPCFVSNSCDAPQEPKTIGILLDRVKHLRIEGGGVSGPDKTAIVYQGRMIQILHDHAENVTFTGLTFDLARPTVSEIRVLEANKDRAVVQVAEGSDYAVVDGRFQWRGDWASGSGVLTQEVDLDQGRCRRRSTPRGWSQQGQADATARDLGERKVELVYPNGACDLPPGRQFHFRSTRRDSVAVHCTRSKDIVFQDCDFHCLTNMGFVSQFTENVTFRRVNVAPPAGTIRTCAAWADIFHFSNCKGHMIVEGCTLSGMQDDAINCHGTHLRIIEKQGENRLLLRFMHPQTYGFAAFAPGDEVAVIHHANLREYPDNPRRKVTAVDRVDDKNWLLTLDGPAPSFQANDAIDNLTWYPDLTARNNHVSIDPVRGFLITTRGKVLVENNTFLRCTMAAILVEDDAEGWFESGPVRDLTIRANRFIDCGISINPMSKSKDPAEPVHENIRIEGNYFTGAGVSAHHVKGLTLRDNRTTDATLPLQLAPTCTAVTHEGTQTGVKPLAIDDLRRPQAADR